MTQVPGEEGPERRALSRRAVAAATIGNALEFYDFVTYAYFSIQIGRTFFPSHDAYASLMLSLATFGAGFVSRPVGGLVIGAYADRVGRRPAMMLSFTLMGAAIVALALIPSYARIGVAAPVLAVTARLAQGFSLGGEVGPTTAFLMEAAPPERRGLAVSWQAAGQALAAMAAGLVGAGLSGVMTPAALDGYGWRVAFLIGASVLPFGLWLRRNLPETLHAPEPAIRAPAIRAPASRAPASRTGPGLARQNARLLVLALLALGSGTVGAYAFNYMTTYAEGVLRLKPDAAFLAPALGNAAGAVSVLLGGWLSDRFGRRPLMIWPGLASLVIVLPVFEWIIRTRSSLAFIVGLTSLGFVGALGSGAFFTAFSESLPKRIRGGAFATVYACAIALFGGGTQLGVTWLIHATGQPMAPAWCMLGASAVGLAAKMLILESAPARAGRRAGSDGSA